jgi:hypothetical protein
LHSCRVSEHPLSAKTDFFGVRPARCRGMAAGLQPGCSLFRGWLRGDHGVKGASRTKGRRPGTPRLSPNRCLPAGKKKRGPGWLVFCLRLLPRDRSKLPPRKTSPGVFPRDPSSICSRRGQRRRVRLGLAFYFRGACVETFSSRSNFFPWRRTLRKSRSGLRTCAGAFL